jgi:hypothetical protein
MRLRFVIEVVIEIARPEGRQQAQPCRFHGAHD